MTKSKSPSLGEIWLINLNPTKRHEQAGTRPCLVISANLLNHRPADLAVVLPITTTDRGIPSHVRVDAPAGGLREVRYITCEDLRSVSISRRFITRWGRADDSTTRRAQRIIRFLLDL